MKPVRRSIAAALGAAAAVHAAPYVLTLGAYEPLRLRVLRNKWPELYGIGRKGHLALTFDDGPDARGTEPILDVLDEQGAKATFFMLGEMVRRNPNVAREVAARGHEIGVHGYAHQSFMRMHLGAAVEDIKRASEAIQDATGVGVERFRPPYGTLSASALGAARFLGLRTTLWTAWGKDWQSGTTPVRIAANLTSGVLDGGTVLLHDSDCTSASSSWRRTLDALPLLAELAQHEGLQIGPLRDHA